MKNDNKEVPLLGPLFSLSSVSSSPQSTNQPLLLTGLSSLSTAKPENNLSSLSGSLSSSATTRKTSPNQPLLLSGLPSSSTSQSSASSSPQLGSSNKPLLLSGLSSLSATSESPSSITTNKPSLLSGLSSLSTSSPFSVTSTTTSNNQPLLLSGLSSSTSHTLSKPSSLLSSSSNNNNSKSLPSAGTSTSNPPTLLSLSSLGNQPQVHTQTPQGLPLSSLSSLNEPLSSLSSLRRQHNNDNNTIISKGKAADNSGSTMFRPNISNQSLSSLANVPLGHLNRHSSNNNQNNNQKDAILTKQQQHQQQQQQPQQLQRQQHQQQQTQKNEKKKGPPKIEAHPAKVVTPLGNVFFKSEQNRNHYFNNWSRIEKIISETIWTMGMDEDTIEDLYADFFETSDTRHNVRLKKKEEELMPVFLFDTPSPDDIAISKQEKAFGKNARLR